MLTGNFEYLRLLIKVSAHLESFGKASKSCIMCSYTCRLIQLELEL